MSRTAVTSMKVLAALALVTLLWGCDTAPGAAPAGVPAETVAAEEPPAQPESVLLPVPFTAEEIRDEWIEGLTLVLRTRTPGGETWERWTVVAADADGADIEFSPVDAEGNAAGEARVERSSWTELRDHASYPVDVASREQVSRDTALGQLAGWLYRVRDEATGSETELFFASQLPGAPVEMRMSKDGTVAMELTQVERHKPAD